MWVILRVSFCVLGFAALVSTASAKVIADFGAEFQPGTPAAGWSYLWNANGPLGNSANYVPLVANNGSYETGLPGSALAVSGTAVVPGLGTAQDPAGLERAAILAYTVSADDLLGAPGALAYIDGYHFVVPLASEDGVSASIYVNDMPILPGLPLPPGMDYDTTAPNAYPMPLGPVNVGDTIYIAIGSRATDTGDQLGISYNIQLVPEPAALSLLGLMSLGLLRRRR